MALTEEQLDALRSASPPDGGPGDDEQARIAGFKARCRLEGIDDPPPQDADIRDALRSLAPSA